MHVVFIVVNDIHIEQRTPIMAFITNILLSQRMGYLPHKIRTRHSVTLCVYMCGLGQFTYFIETSWNWDAFRITSITTFVLGSHLLTMDFQHKGSIMEGFDGFFVGSFDKILNKQSSERR